MTEIQIFKGTIRFCGPNRVGKFLRLAAYFWTSPLVKPLNVFRKNENRSKPLEKHFIFWNFLRPKFGSHCENLYHFQSEIQSATLWYQRTQCRVLFPRYIKVTNVWHWKKLWHLVSVTNLFPVNTLFWHHYDLTIQFRVIKFNIFVVLSFLPLLMF